MECKCEFCNKIYKTEKGFLNHKCLKRDIYNSKDKLLYRIWVSFASVYNIKLPKEDKDIWLKLCQSSYLNNIIQLKDYLMEYDVINIYEFFIYLKYNKILINKLFKNKEQYFKRFLKYFLNNEKETVACIRSEEYIRKECGSTLSSNRLYFGLLSGKISFKYIQNRKLDLKTLLDEKQYNEIKELYNL